MYNYLTAVTSDVKDFLKDNYSQEEINNFTEDDVYDLCCNEDEVTGNLYGYDYPEVVQDYVKEHLYDALAAAAEYGLTLQDILNADTDIAQFLDTLMRCHTLAEAAEIALDELKNGGN